MLHTLGIAIARHRLITLIGWAVVTACCLATALGGVTGSTLFQRLSSAGPSVQGEANHASQLLQSTHDKNRESLTLLVYNVDPSSPRLAKALADATEALTTIHGVIGVANPLAFPPLPTGQPNPAAAALLAPDGNGLLLDVSMMKSHGRISEKLLGEVEARLDAAADDVRTLAPKATAEVGGSPLLVKSLAHVAESDLQRGELISLPIALLVMLIIFGGFLAAGIPCSAPSPPSSARWVRCMRSAT